MITDWTGETHRGWRRTRRFALLPRRTFDQGRTWLRLVWRRRCHSGWGVFDGFAYRSRDGATPPADDHRAADRRRPTDHRRHHPGLDCGAPGDLAKDRQATGSS